MPCKFDAGSSNLCSFTGQNVHSISIYLRKHCYHFFFSSGAERVLHLRLEMPDELPPLIIEMLDRTENVCIP